MTTSERAEQMVQQLRTLSMTYAAAHYDYIQSLKGDDGNLIVDCRMKMIRAYKELDSVAKAMKSVLSRTGADVIPFSNWGKLTETLSKIEDNNY